MKALALILSLCAALGAVPAAAEAPDRALRPAARPAPPEPVRPVLRGGDPVVAVPETVPETVLETVAISSISRPPQALARQEALAEALLAPLPAVFVPVPAAVAVPLQRSARQMDRAEALMGAAPAPRLVATVWTGVWPELRPEGDFSGGADVPARVFRPIARPGDAPEQVVLASAAVVAPPLAGPAVLRPAPRPALHAAPAPQVPETEEPETEVPETEVPETEVPGTEVPGTEAVITPAALVSPAPVQLSALAAPRALRPTLRPQQVVQRAETARVTRQRGSVCGNAAIQGEAIAAISGNGGCGVAEPVRIRSIGGVSLSQPSTMDCQTASALLTWVERGAQPAIGDLGGGIAGLQVAGHYACRPRNNQAGARLSEHGKGRAIDISGIVLRNGTVIRILNGWNSGPYGERLRAMHRAACGPFGTVLGPNANRFHADHFHFDTARYRSGSYCR